MLEGVVSFFNELKTRCKLCSKGVVLFFNELKTKSKLCSEVLILEHNENQKGFQSQHRNYTYADSNRCYSGGIEGKWP